MFNASRVMVLMAVLGLPAGMLHAHGYIRNCTPVAWMADDVPWIRDVAPHNKIDDLIDRSTALTFDLVVNYRHCVGPADVQALQAVDPSLQVRMIGRYIPFVAVSGVPAVQVPRVASLPGVAFIESQVGVVSSLDVSVPTIKVTPGSGIYSPTTVREWNPSLTGTGINIAILDTGVDDGGGEIPPTHDGLPAAVHFYDAVTRTQTNPDDDDSHGTAVASVALGSATTGTSEGVAPGAGLVDVRVSNDTTNVCGSRRVWMDTMDGLQMTYDMRDAWDVKVINMSIGECDAAGTVVSDGNDAMSQLVNLAASMGIVVVTSGGNYETTAPRLSAPAVASGAIAVAASDDMENDDRANDIIWEGSSIGPRSPGTHIDDLKPDVAAPGADISCAQYDTSTGSLTGSGTSIAAPHVAGLAALLLQARPTINIASVKDEIIRTAETRFSDPNVQIVDPLWDEHWGWGLVNGYRMVHDLRTADVTFPGGPQAIPFVTPDIWASSYFPIAGVPIAIHVNIKNLGPFPASRVRVQLGVRAVAADGMPFHHIDTRIVDTLDPDGIRTVNFFYTPQETAPSALCYEAEIGYGPDLDYTNNVATLCVAYAQAPAPFRMQNTLSPSPAPITFVPTLGNPKSKWVVTITPPQITLGGDDCPAEILVSLTPPDNAPPESFETVNIRAMAGTTYLGGVAFGRTAGPDDDADGVWNGADNCPDSGNPDQTDADQDGHGNACDCGPTLPGVWAKPAEVEPVSAAQDASGPQTISLNWPSLAVQAGPAVVYDVASGSLSKLRTAGYQGASCRANDLSNTAFVDDQPVPVGDGLWYLVRGDDDCGHGTWGDGSGTPDPRDPLDGALSPCP